MYALTVGVPYDLFWHLTPTKLEPFFEAHKKRQIELDTQMWYMGQYIMSALDATVCNGFVWRDKNSKRGEYVDRPFLEQAEAKKKQEQLTEEEKIKRTEALFLQLEVFANNEKRQKKAMEKKGKAE